MNNTTDYHITKNMPEIKMKSILSVEGPCPVCGSKNTFFKTYYRHQNKMWQNSYNCKDCKSEWKGNTYDNGFRRVTHKDEQRLIRQQNSSICLIL